MKKILIYFICFLIFVVFFGSCKDKNPNPIQDCTVHFVVNLAADDNDLTIGSAKKFTSGAGYFGCSGVVVYRHGLEEFFAYDLACPNDWYYYCAVADSMPRKFVPEELVVRCSTCCRATFSLLDGYPRSSHNKYPLKKYKVERISDTRFRVTN